MSLSDPTLRLIFVDLLFLGLAGAMAFWFRAWLKEQKGEMDRRIASLETQQQSLARLGERLSSVCRTLERHAPAVVGEALTRGRGSTSPAAATEPTRDAQRPAERARVTPTAPVPADRRVTTPASRADRQWEELSDRSRESYRRARDLLDQGLSSAEIARRVGLGVAEVNVLKRMRDAGRR